MDPPKANQANKTIQTFRNKQKQTDTNRNKHNKQAKQVAKKMKKTNSQLPKSNDDYNVHNCF